MGQADWRPRPLRQHALRMGTRAISTAVVARAGSVAVVVVLALVVAAGASGASGASLSPSQAPASTGVLFIGNSLTYANALPQLVVALARADGRELVAESIAFPDVSLEDHWTRGDAARAIAKGGWHWVVLQQGPSALPASRALLVDYVARFDRLIRAAGARTALYMVWPSIARAADLDAVSDSYRTAADAVGGVLLPVGDAWRAARALDPTVPLYGTDGFHPTPEGTALAALVIYERLTGRVAPVAALTQIPKARRDVLARAARQVLSGSGTRSSTPR